MITDIEIRNFKALANFRIPGLGKLVCLIGMNGVGKSTLLQALDFVANSFDNLTNFRDWKRADILGAGGKGRSCAFKIGMQLTSGCALTWSGRFNVDKWRFIEGTVQFAAGEILLQLRDGKLAVNDGVTESFDLSDSTFSGLSLSTRKFENSPRLKELKAAFLELKSFELLAPDELRHGARNTKEMSLGGVDWPDISSCLMPMVRRAS